jgi:(R,R)-butanediol dehydrogenase / meso-butanediol dehydrogenase / diacetyl reductase
MKALRWYGEKDIRYEDVPEPSPKPGQIKVKVNLVGICGSEMSNYNSKGSHTALTLGHEFAGVVVELGKGVTDFKIGDRVTAVCYWYCNKCYYCEKGLYNLCINPSVLGHDADGGMAEYAVGGERAFYKMPDNVSDELGALVEPISVALHGVRQGKVSPGDKVVIIGAGPIGLSAILSAKAAGATEVFVVEKLKGRRNIAEKMGATAVFGLDENDPIEAIRKLTNGLGADVTLDCVGRPETPQLAVNMTKRGGYTVIVGLNHQTSQFHFGELTFLEVNIVGSSVYIHEPETVLSYLSDRRIDPSPMITSKIHLKDGVKLGFELLATKPDDHIKTLLQIS